MAIVKAGIAAARPERCLAAVLEPDEVAPGPPEREIVVVGAGKAAAAMAVQAESRLGPRIGAGVVAVKDGHVLPLDRIGLLEAAHPVPDSRAQRNGRRIRETIAGAPQDALILALFSGGGSALIIDPISPAEIEDLASTTDILLRAGADIGQLNTIRKHLSATHAGRLARVAAGRDVLVVAISDVLGDDLSTIASGPFCPDPSTWQDAAAVVDHFDLWRRLPAAVARILARGRDGELAETPKPGDGVFARVHHRVVANLRTAAQAASDHAESLGIHSRICDLAVTGQAEAAAEGLIRAGRAELGRTANPFCLVYGGETVVRVRGQGRGGRCQQLALQAAAALAGEPRLTILAAGTDGTDGPTDAAGAVVDAGTIARGARCGLDASQHLKDNDAYRFLGASGDLIFTGPTHTNVNDLLLVLGSP
jgi:glycerate-2-kinase